MPDAPSPPNPAALSVRFRIALAIAGVAAGMGITLACLRAFDPDLPEAFRPAPAPPATPAPPADARPPTGVQFDAAWMALRQLSITLSTDGGAEGLYRSSAMLQDAYATPEAWSQAVSALQLRLAELPAARPPAGSATTFDLRTHPGDRGVQDIMSVTTADGGRVSVFFEAGQADEFDAR